MKDKLPESLEELCDYILEYQDSIFIREEINGKWGTYSLSELPTSKAIKHTLEFIKEGRIPVRVIK